jgi:glycerophosphoryl diester phosphodiesterase
MSAPKSPRPLLLGHRGASKYAPENTIQAFDLALAHGCDGFEFDVRYSSDGRTVISHDPRLNGREIARTSYVDLSLRSQPKPPRISAKSAPASHPIATLTGLEDVIARYANSAFLDIELKATGEIEHWLAALKANPPQRRFVISSFLPELIQAIHKRDASLPLGLIADTRAQLSWWRELPISTLILHTQLVSPSVLNEAHDARKKVYAWTVNRREQMQALTARGVDGIISDDTRLLGATFKQD